jgi:hypothetical protein
MGVKTTSRTTLRGIPAHTPDTRPAVLARFAEQLRSDRLTTLDTEATDDLGRTLAALLEDSDDDTYAILPELTDPELAGNALALFSSINHRFWELDPHGEFRPLYYTVDGEPMKGSNYLHGRFAAMAATDPDFFSTDHLWSFTREKFDRLMGVGVMPDADERFEIMRDFITGTMVHHCASIDRIWHGEAGETIEGLHHILDRTLGFHDELQKKTQMLYKFLHDAGLWTARDPENILPPCDYHLMNIAIKAGAIRILDPGLRRKLVAREPLTPPETRAIRLRALEAYDSIAREQGVNPHRLDDILWQESRQHCQDTTPRCADCSLEGCCRCEGDLLRGFPVCLTNAF